MALTRKQVVTCISIVYLLAAAALYGSSRLSQLSIPLSSILSNLTTALPLVAGLLLEGSYDLTRRQEKRRHAARGSTPRPPLVIIANTLIFIYSSVVLTLLGTHAGPPSGLDCGLEQRWKNMFSLKDSEGIRAIQDAFECCGLVNSHDRAWPFQDKTHDIHACETAFGRNTGCMGAWRREEQRMGGLLIGVVSMVLVWQLAIIAIPTNRSSWLHRVLPGRVSEILTDEEQATTNGRARAIDYHSSYDRYRDDPLAEVTDSEDESTPQRGIEPGPASQVTDAVTAGVDQPDLEQHDEPTENTWARH
ncbi:hypothetical protein BCR34DRAFT_139767 [Clohesyomyces aquaticus]|uniref:Tetraspanin Tsp3 n=1 Tax=Clohesyomyces aquaticus TaxID=1231657 RepID=A0A1Y1YNE5_9PLEO|nr:hypothetical protein BCR34DRAFT_139767 [Clohesyomyces aquaticus]